jgi:hypothetical protein
VPPKGDVMRRSRAWKREDRKLPLLVLGAVCAGLVFASASAQADWVWDVGYLWNASAPFSVTVESHANATWTQWLSQSAADWSKSGVVSVSVGSSGKIALYDDYYGASQPCAWTMYWQHGGHIAHDAIYLNETCLAGWTDFWKQYAVCQELGHALGLPDHNTTPTAASCMAPGMPATTPSSDDFAELALLYGVTTTSSNSNQGKGGGKGGTPLSGGTTATTTTTDTTTITTTDTTTTTTGPGNGNGAGGSGSDGSHPGNGHSPGH